MTTIRLCKLESVFIVSSSVTFQPQSHFRCSGVQSFLLWPSLRTEEFLCQVNSCLLTGTCGHNEIPIPLAHSQASGTGSSFPLGSLWLTVHTKLSLWLTVHSLRNNRLCATRAIDMAPNTYKKIQEQSNIYQAQVDSAGQQ